MKAAKGLGSVTARVRAKADMDPCIVMVSRNSSHRSLHSNSSVELDW